MNRPIHRIRISQALIALMCIVAITSPACAAYFYVDDGNGGTYNIKTQTLLDMRYYHIDRQRYDFSCGSAALASLLTYHYRRPVDERVIIKSMYAAGDQDKIKREGFSLLDMKNYLQSIGLHSNGYHESLDKLSKVGIPAIVLINRKGYLHFVLVQGVTRDKVLFGDPALGKKIMDRKKFEAMWTNGILFVVEDNMDYARRTFNTNWAWHVKKPEKFDMPMPNTDLANMARLTAYDPNSFHTQ
jgi:predicted double-glycine peptidase